MRDEIVQPIEQNFAGTQDLQTINSVVQQGSASISAVFDIKSDTATDLALTNKAVQASEKFLPTNITPPTVNLYDPTESTVVVLALYSEKLPINELALYAQNVIAPQLEQVPGISFANVGGLVTPAYEIQVDPVKLAADNLTLNDVINTVSTNNPRVPGGFAYEPNRQTTIDVRGDITTLENVRNLPIIVSGASQTNEQPGRSQTSTAALPVCLAKSIRGRRATPSCASATSPRSHRATNRASRSRTSAGSPGCFSRCKRPRKQVRLTLLTP